jgi:hypothetical protein
LLGVIALTLSVAAATLASQYLQSAKQFEEALVLSYVSESALRVTWDDMQYVSWQDIPRRKRWAFQDELGLLEEGQQVELNCTTSVTDTQSLKGALRASASHKGTLMIRSCCLTFEAPIVAGSEETRYAVQHMMY